MTAVHVEIVSIKPAPPIMTPNDSPSPFDILSAALRRRPRLSRALIAAFIFLLILRLEWAYFRPRIFLFGQTFAAPDDDTLPIRLLAAEDAYQKTLRQRQELIFRAGPGRENVNP